ncbi:MAG: hypothetical protein IJH64_02105 [Oscillospiraceae bacterium]|nr:hypothetical protein [Oscillospiraceae bacterium]
MRLIDADEVVTIDVYDDMTEEWHTERITIADAIDKWSYEGCPPSIEPTPKRVANVGTNGRLIDGAALKKQGWRLCRTVHGVDTSTYETKDIEDVPTVPFIDISVLPIVDNYEIVRCKDCKWWRNVGCAIRIVDESDEPKDNDYCSFWERREDGKTD